jgi:hypothetical protein
MSNVNISHSKIEQMSDSGNNYKFAGKAENIALSEQGNAVQTTGTGNKLQVNKPEKGLWTVIWRKLKAAWKLFTG